MLCKSTIHRLSVQCGVLGGDTFDAATTFARAIEREARRQALEARTASEMTRDEIIKLAMEAGIPIETDWAGRPSTLVIKDGGTYLRGIDDLVRFAELVAAEIRARESSND